VVLAHADPIQETADERVAACSPAPLLALNSVTKRFGPTVALDDVSIAFETGQVHCLLGENGAGKSTLCNLVIGLHQPDVGSMILGGERYAPRDPAEAFAHDIAMVHQHFSLVPTLSVLDNLLLGRSAGILLRRRTHERRIVELAEAYGLPVPLRRMTGDLSVGERQRVEILKCLIGEPKLLLLDEPTAVLPPTEIDSLIDTIRRIAADGRAVVLVTHKLAEIERVADRVTVLRGGRVVESVAMRNANMQSLVRAMVGRDIRALDATLAASIGVDEPKVGEAAQIGSDRDKGDKDKKEKVRRAEDAFIIDGLTINDRQTGATRLNNFTLVVPKGEIVGLAGVEGNGQTELGLALSGLTKPTSGRFFVGDKELTNCSPAEITASGVGYIPEDRHAVGCIVGMSAAENLFLGPLGRVSSRLGALQTKRMAEAAETVMRRFDVRGAGPAAPMSGFSGGNQQKLVLAREFSLDPLTFVLAAHPTRGLDVGAVEAVYRQLRAVCRERGVGVLLISSEIDELLAVADRIAVIYRGEIVGELPRERFSRETIGALMSGHRLQ
jgi:ABC-type uncharacterized transport system ATPase subunit